MVFVLLPLSLNIRFAHLPIVSFFRSAARRSAVKMQLYSSAAVRGLKVWWSHLVFYPARAHVVCAQLIKQPGKKRRAKTRNIQLFIRNVNPNVWHITTNRRRPT